MDNLRIPIAESRRISGTTPYYGANGIQDYVDGFTHDGENLLIAEDGANDLKNYPVCYVKGKIWVNNHAHVLKSRENIDLLFLKYAFSTINMESVIVGGSRSKLNANILMNLCVKVPKLDEQTKIGQYLYSLDSLITLHQRKVFNYHMNFILGNSVSLVKSLIKAEKRTSMISHMKVTRFPTLKDL